MPDTREEYPPSTQWDLIDEGMIDSNDSYFLQSPDHFETITFYFLHCQQWIAVTSDRSTHELVLYDCDGMKWIPR